jgi:hypothetical protein
MLCCLIFRCCLLLLLAAGLAAPQSVNTNRPTDIPASQPSSTAEARRAEAAKVQLSKDVDELSKLSAELVSDLEHVKQGMFPKDMQDKLSRVEKLSKRVRQELGQ